MKVAVLKGFVFNVNWNSQKEILDDVVASVKDYDAIAWDGDLYKKDSFTHVLKHVMKTYPKKRYIAFKKEKHIHKLQAGYKENNHGVMSYGYNANIKINIIPMPNEIGFKNIGIQGILKLQRMFKRVDIIFMGQGAVAKDEENRIMKAKQIFPNVTIKKYNVKRPEKFTNMPANIQRKVFNKLNTKNKVSFSGTSKSAHNAVNKDMKHVKKTHIEQKLNSHLKNKLYKKLQSKVNSMAMNNLENNMMNIDPNNWGRFFTMWRRGEASIPQRYKNNAYLQLSKSKKINKPIKNLLPANIMKLLN